VLFNICPVSSNWHFKYLIQIFENETSILR
jgi:hypothetical protein